MKKSTLKLLLKSTKDRVIRLKKQISKLRETHEEEYEENIPSPKKPKESKENEIIVKFSLVSIAKATIVVLFLLLAANFFQDIGEILLVFFVSLLFAAALDPTVDKLEEYKIPRPVSVIGIYLLLLSVLAFFISQLIPLIASQLLELARTASDLIVNITSDTESSIPFYDKIQPFVSELVGEVDRDLIVNELKGSLETLGQYLQSFAGDTVGVIVSLFNGIFNFFLVLILTFFLVIEEKGVDKFFISLFPSKHGKYIIEKSEAIKHKIGFWLRGQIILMFVMFILTWIGLSILKVEFALTLAMIAGLAEIIPVLGPIIAGVPAVLVAFNQSPWLALWVILMIIILQQLEGNLIVPVIMKKAVGLSPIIIILAMLIGFAKLKILGTIIAVPVATALAIFVNDYTAKKK